MIQQSTRFPLAAVPAAVTERLNLPTSGMTGDETVRRGRAVDDLFARSRLAFNTFYLPMLCRYRLYDRSGAVVYTSPRVRLGPALPPVELLCRSVMRSFSLCAWITYTPWHLTVDTSAMVPRRLLHRVVRADILLSPDHPVRARRKEFTVRNETFEPVAAPLLLPVKSDSARRRKRLKRLARTLRRLLPSGRVFRTLASHFAKIAKIGRSDCQEIHKYCVFLQNIRPILPYFNHVVHSKMKRNFSSLFTKALLSVMSLCIMTSCDKAVRSVDILIIGGGASGVAAGVQAARMGADALIVEPTTWLGGMLTSAGVSAVDGNYRMPAGIFGEFRQHLAEHYGGLDSLKTGWVSNVLFEPSVGNAVMHRLVEAEPLLSVIYQASPVDVTQQPDGSWKATFMADDGKSFEVKARMLIDGTELGDIARLVGVGYDLGMESRFVTGEDIAPDSARNIVQDITMVATLKDYGRDVTMPEPEDYDPQEFACTCDNSLCDDPDHIGHNYSPSWMMAYGKLPNDKYMINWPVAGNDIYINLVDMTPGERDEALKEAKAKTLRYVYFLQHELGMNTLGLADDEYPTDDLLPLMPYHRESRRIHGISRFTLNHITHPYDTPDPLYRTAIAVGDYPVDHHHKAYDGPDSLPKIGFYPIPSYGLPAGTLIPADVDNMLVTEKSISVSNIVNGTTRLQPVVVQIGQAAGAIAAIALADNVSPASVSVRKVQKAILDAGGYIMPFLDVDKSDPRFIPYQHIGAAGILRGEGRNVDWNNQTWLRADQPLMTSELDDFCGFYGLPVMKFEADAPVTLSMAVDLIDDVMTQLTLDDALKVLSRYGVDSKAASDALTRGEFALIVDAVLDPFSLRDVDFNGRFIEL